MKRAMLLITRVLFLFVSGFTPKNRRSEPLRRWAVLPIIGVALLLSGCGSANLRVDSNPKGADVSISYGNESTETAIGKTPLEVDNRFLESGRGDHAKLVVRKAGYLSESITLPTSRLKTAVNLSVNLKETSIPQECLALDQTTEKVAKSVAAAQALIQSRNYELAERQLLNLQSEFPNVSVVYDLLGNVSYLKKDFGAALKYYKKSLSIAPGNPETARMIDKLSRITGDRVPSSEEN